MYLLDTNHCSRIINGDSAIISQLQQNSSAGVATSAIVRGELIFMAQNSQQQASNHEAHPTWQSRGGGVGC